jgi:hypothetical protein
VADLKRWAKKMKRVELLTVSDSFAITGRGIVVLPDFSVPPGGWKDRKEELTIISPTGQSSEATALVSVTHFTFSDRTVSADRRLRVVVMIQGRKKEEIPAGSRLFFSHEIRDLLSQKKEPNQAPEPTGLLARGSS